VEHDRTATNQIVMRLRKYLDRYYAADPEGLQSPLRLTIEELKVGPGGPRFRLTMTRKQIFLCHSSGDKTRVRQVKTRLLADGFSRWLDEDDLLPGHDWEQEIRRAVRRSSAVLVFLSPSSVTKEGFVQKEIRFALDVADEKPDGTIYNHSSPTARMFSSGTDEEMALGRSVRAKRI
jgi:hypothetical protein